MPKTGILGVGGVIGAYFNHLFEKKKEEVIRLSNKFLLSFNDKDMKKGGKSDSYYRKLVIAIRKDMGGWDKNELLEKDIDIRMLNE